MDLVRAALTGLGGYGAVHLGAAQSLEDEGLLEIAAFAEANRTLPACEALVQRGATGYSSFTDMLDSEADLDLICVATPIPTHFPMAKAAFERGLHLFLEKPPAVRIQDFRALLAAQESAGTFCTVGFQDTARSDVIALKHRLCEGAIGRIKAVRAFAVRQRDSNYYARTPWAGQAILEGRYVLDGPINNSCAHVLNLACFFAGGEPHEFALPKKVQAELYRAAPIANEDTNCIRAATLNNIELCIHLTQAGPANLPRHWEIVGENGTASYDDAAGAKINGASLGESPSSNDLATTLLRRLAEVAVGSDEPLLMPLAECEAFVLLSNGAYESSRQVKPVPAEYTHCVQTEGGGVAWVIDDLGETIPEAALERRMLSDCGFPWASKTGVFDLTDYDMFPQRWQEELPEGIPAH